MHKIFISYSSQNADWAKNWLVPKIESRGGECRAKSARASCHCERNDQKMGCGRRKPEVEALQCELKALQILN
jgi:hypothetical protein